MGPGYIGNQQELNVQVHLWVSVLLIIKNFYFNVT